MKLIGSTKSKITKDENIENVPHLEITKIVSKVVILLTMIISKIQEYCIHLFLINHMINY